jgi:ADP-ribosyl-[dinitrogen reductase] hydrolase
MTDTGLAAFEDPGFAEALEHLANRRLLPTGVAPDAQPDLLTLERRVASAQGAMVGTAVGDALGRQAEGRDPRRLAKERERFLDYQRWAGWRWGPVGTYTDDTQMTLCVARSLLAASGRLDPADLGRRFVDWLPVGRGKGRTCTAACLNLQGGVPWWSAGEPSAGNGAPMRAAPVGIALGHDTAALVHDAALSAVVTHADSMAVAATIGHAWLVARLAAEVPGHVDLAALVNELVLAVEAMPEPGQPERDWQDRPGKTGDPVRLADHLGRVPEFLGAAPREALGFFYNGAYVLETMPAALWCFLNYLDDPEEGVLAAVLAGRDADTVASITAAYFGALYGVDAFPARWTGSNLESSARLRELGEQLATGPGPV